MFEERISNEIFFILVNKYYDEGSINIIWNTSFLDGVVRLFLDNNEDVNKIVNAIKNTKLNDIKIFEKDLEEAKRDFCDFMKTSNTIKGDLIRKLKEIEKDETDLSFLNYFINLKQMQKEGLESKKINLLVEI